MRQMITGRRVRGYRIHIFRGAREEPPSITTPLMWREDPPLDEWQHTINDPSTQQAWMIRSGRKMKQFQFHRERETTLYD
jgi:hypothetical protein